MKLRTLLLIAFVLSGMAALIYEVVWIRPLQYILGSTIYTVSIVFAAFMAGLALGSKIISKYVDRIKNLPRAYALMELGIGLYGILMLIIFNFTTSVYRLIFPLHESFYIFEFIQFILVFVILLIPTTLMGATFPIIAKFYTKEKIGKGVGEVYSANNIGAILGSIAAGFILIPLLGIKSTIIFAGLINIFVAFVILLISSISLAKRIIPISLVIFTIFIFIGNYDIDKLYESGFNRAAFPKELVQQTEILFYEEGLHATVNVVYEKGITSFLINGFGQGSTASKDIRVNFLLAYLPILINPQANNALVIGLGTGTTSGQLSKFVKTTTVEIESAVVDASKFFWFINENVTKNPNHNLVIEDARNYLLKNKDKYDFIVSEPTNTWLSFSTALFSKEFFELVGEHLNDDGLYLQWVPIYDFTPEDFRSFYKTFNSEFPYNIGFLNLREEETETRLPTSEIIFVGSKSPISYKDIGKNFAFLPTNSKEYLGVIRINSSDQILALLQFTSDEMQGFGSDSKFVTDDNALLEFSTALSPFSTSAGAVIEDINKFLENRKNE